MTVPAGFNVYSKVCKQYVYSEYDMTYVSGGSSGCGGPSGRH